MLAAILLFSTKMDVNSLNSKGENYFKVNLFTYIYIVQVRQLNLH